MNIHLYIICIGILQTFNMRKIQAFIKPHFSPLKTMGNSLNFNNPKESQCSIYMVTKIKTLRLRQCSSTKWTRCSSSNRYRNYKNSTNNKTFSLLILTKMSKSIVHNNIISITIHLMPKKMSSNTLIDHRLVLQQTSKNSNTAYR